MDSYGLNLLDSDRVASDRPDRLVGALTILPRSFVGPDDLYDVSVPFYHQGARRARTVSTLETSAS